MVGIGDDAAVVRGSSQHVITTDVAVEDVHFNKRWSNAFDIGRKVTAANIADVLAMGATPQYLVVALSLVGDEGLERVRELAEGIKHEADKTGAHVVGGDIARAGAISIAITAIGSVERAITRSGAQVGDGIYISSLTGWFPRPQPAEQPAFVYQRGTPFQRESRNPILSYPRPHGLRVARKPHQEPAGNKSAAGAKKRVCEDF